MKGKTAYFTCPYCGYSNHAWVKMDDDGKPLVVSCDPENGGCDRYFVVIHHISVKTTVMPLGKEVA
jgi:transcription elongation factor Elf1